MTRSSYALCDISNIQLVVSFLCKAFLDTYPVVKHPINRYIVMSWLHSIIRTIDASYSQHVSVTLIPKPHDLREVEACQLSCEIINYCCLHMHVCVHSYHGYDQITDTNCIGSYIHWYPGAGACDKRFFLLVGELCTVQSCRNAN